MGFVLKLSIGMMVKNEESNLERCLSSLQPLMQAVSSELIIVDTGSSDGTVAIAKRYTDKVYFHLWENDYSKMRNITVGYAKGEWFLFIDADEELVEYGDIVDFLLGGKSKCFHAAVIKIKNFVQTETESNFVDALVMRLFRKKKTFRFEGVVHEQPMFEPPVYILNAMLKHYGYLADDSALKERKLKLYEPILLRALEENPRNIYYWYQLSRTYTTYKDRKTALSPGVKAYEIIKEQKQNELNDREYPYVYQNLSYLYLMNEQPRKSIEIAQEWLTKDEEFVDLWFYTAKAQALTKQTEKAIESYRKYMEYAKLYDKNGGKDVRIAYHTLTNREEAWLDLSILYKEESRNAEAMEALREIKSAYWLKQAAAHGIKLALDLQNYDFLKEFCEKFKTADEQRLSNHFYRVLEEQLLGYKAEREAIARLFRDEATEYGLLNRIRLLGDSAMVDVGVLEALGKLPLSELDSYYGDVFYFIIKKKQSLDFIDLHIYEENLEQFFQYLDMKYSDLPEIYYDYLQGGDDYSLEELRIVKIMERKLLLGDSLEDQHYEAVWNRYVADGIAYIRHIYHGNILTGDNAHLFKNREDAFFMYMGLARELEASNRTAYVRNLKQALRIYPEMKKRIELLLKRITEQMPVEKSPVSAEMAAYAQIVKKNLRQLMDQKMFQEAREIIRSFEEILPGDPDIGRMKAELE